jgi:hypothetical protein
MNTIFGAGYDDTWIKKYGDNKEQDGFTCCPEEFLEHEAGEIIFRIDYVFVPEIVFKVKKIEIVATKAIDQTDSGKWYGIQIMQVLLRKSHSGNWKRSLENLQLV